VSGLVAWVDPTVAVQELLFGSERSFMQFFRTLHQSEACAEFVVEGFGVVTNYVEPAALRRALWPKGPNNDVATSPYRVRYPFDVRRTFLIGRQEVEHGAIMPNIVGLRFKDDSSNVSKDPTNPGGGFFQTLSRHIDRGLGNIQDRDVLITSR
jgi:hypothetical protein